MGGAYVTRSADTFSGREYYLYCRVRVRVRDSPSPRARKNKERSAIHKEHNGTCMVHLLGVYSACMCTPGGVW